MLLDEKPGAELVDDEAARKKPWRKLLANMEVPVVVAIDASGRPRELVAREVAVAAVNRKAEVAGKESPFVDADKPQDRPDADAAKEAREKKKLEEKIEARAVVIALKKLLQRVACEGLGIEELRGVVDALLEFECNREQLVLIGQAMDQQIEGHDQMAALKNLREHLWAVERSRDELLAVVVVSQASIFSWNGLKAAPLVKLAGLLGVSLTESRLEARDEIKKKTRTKKEPKPEVVTEIVNAEVAVGGILAEGDAQREAMPSRALDAPAPKKKAAKRLEDVPGDVQGTEVLPVDFWAVPSHKSSNAAHAYKDGKALCGSPLEASSLHWEAPGCLGCKKCKKIVFSGRDVQGTEVLPVARVIECKDVQEWVETLLHAPLPCSPVNEHGVLTDVVEIRLPMLKPDGKKAKAGRCCVELGWAGGDQYAAGYLWDRGGGVSTGTLSAYGAASDIRPCRVSAAMPAVEALRHGMRGIENDAMAGVLSTALVLLEKALPAEEPVDGEEVAA